MMLLAEKRASDDIYKAVPAQFVAAEQRSLALLIITVNGRNGVRAGSPAIYSVARREARR